MRRPTQEYRHIVAPQKTKINPTLTKVLHAVYLTSGSQNPTHWSTLIKHYFSHGSYREALLLYTQCLPRRTHQPLLPLVLKACASLSLLSLGKTLHAESIKVGQDSDIMVGTASVSMYCKCRDLADARKVFDGMPDRNVVTHNAIISGYLAVGDMHSAWVAFDQMRAWSSVTWILMIEGLARVGNIAASRQLFDQIPVEMRTVATWTAMVHGYSVNGDMEAARQLFDDMPCRNYFVWSSMVSGYFKKGNVKEARAIFDQIPVRNLVNWNALIAGCTQNGCCEEALEAFEGMLKDGFEPDEVTIASTLSACAQLGSLESGKKVHKFIEQKKIRLNQFVLSGLVDMYAKCGDLESARGIFEQMNQRNEVCWNSMISGFSTHGRCKEALELFAQMEESVEKPNGITFLAVLSACTHGGFLKEGFEVFSKMGKYGLVAAVGHYACLVDLLGRAGRLNEAYDLIQRMPVRPNDVVLGCFLGACRIHSDAKMAERVIKEFNTSGTRSSDDAGYVLLSNIYAASDRWEEAGKLRRMMAKNRVQKIPGCSSIMVGSIEHQLHSGALAES